MERIVILGAPAAGKSTLARWLAGQLGLVHVELDAIGHGPGWTPTPVETFRAELRARTADGRWVCDGNYFSAAEWIWPQADTIIWLEPPLRLILPRIITRTLRRMITREELWNGNREKGSGLVGRDNLLGWAIKSRRIHRRELPVKLERLAEGGCAVVRLRSRSDVQRWRERHFTGDRAQP